MTTLHTTQRKRWGLLPFLFPSLNRLHPNLGLPHELRFTYPAETCLRFLSLPYFLQLVRPFHPHSFRDLSAFDFSSFIPPLAHATTATWNLIRIRIHCQLMAPILVHDSFVFHSLRFSLFREGLCFRLSDDAGPYAVYSHMHSAYRDKFSVQSDY